MKVTAFLLIISIVFCFTAFTGAAYADSTTTFDISSSASSVATGDTFTVIVTARNVKDMDAYEAHMTFDSDKLTLGKIVTDLKGGTVNQLVKGNVITLAFAKMGNAATENGNITLCSVSFSVKKPGTPKVTLDSIKLLNGILAETDFTVGKTAIVSINDPASVMVKAVLDSATKTTTADVSSNDFQTAINNAVDNTININVLGFEGAQKVLVNIPAQLLSAAEQNQGKTVKINTGLATVSITPDMLKNCIVASSVNFQLSVSTVDVSTLPEGVRKQIGSSTVLDISLSVDGSKVTKFGTGKKIASIEVGYSLKPGENAGKIIVYYLDANGNLQVEKDGKYNPQTGNVVFGPEHFSVFILGYSNKTFSDLTSVSWAKESIEALAARDVIDGPGNGKFNPGDQITRAQFIKILMQAFDLADVSAVSSFSDVKKGEWYYSSIASAQQLKIVSGKSDGSFGINDKITRQDMAVMVYKAAQISKISLDSTASPVKFTDSSAISPYAQAAVTAMQKSGIITGVSNNRFAPKDTATRAQAAVIVYRLFLKS